MSLFKNFDLKNFIIAYLIWMVGFIISILPIGISYICEIANSGMQTVVQLNEFPTAMDLISFFFTNYLFNNADIVYSLISVTTVAFADILLDVFSKGGDAKVRKIVLIIIQLLMIIIETLAYSLFKYASGNFGFIINYANKALLAICIIISTLAYIFKYQEKYYNKYTLEG